MPAAPKRRCSRCPNFMPCAVHTGTRSVRSQNWHGLYGARWQRARVAFLADNPLCIDCLAANTLTPATDVDHEVPHRGDLELFWDRGNWRARCHSCHSRKTATEDGGFGR